MLMTDKGKGFRGRGWLGKLFRVINVQQAWDDG